MNSFPRSLTVLVLVALAGCGATSSTSSPQTRWLRCALTHHAVGQRNL